MLTLFFEKTLNAYINLDSITTDEINQIKDKTLLLEITDINLHFLLFLNGNGIQISQATPEKTDAIIKGKSIDLFLSQFKEDSSSSITIEGDIELGYQIHGILKNIEIDWEEHLSQFTGDFIAHELGKFARKIKKESLEIKNSLSENLKEYLHEESELFPSPLEVENFYHDINRLQQDVDRLEARLLAEEK